MFNTLDYGKQKKDLRLLVNPFSVAGVGHDPTTSGL